MLLEPLQNFTPRAQQVLALARREADRLHSIQVGTVHLLLGLIELGQGPAVIVLKKMNLDLEAVRTAAENEVATPREAGIAGRVPFDRAVKKCLALSGREALNLGHTYLGTEHMLLALLRGSDDSAARVLKSFGVDFERTRTEIIRELS
jgi:ATP-dependent Clp protease ATP-binding subunit ClpC